MISIDTDETIRFTDCLLNISNDNIEETFNDIKGSSLFNSESGRFVVIQQFILVNRVRYKASEAIGKLFIEVCNSKENENFKFLPDGMKSMILSIADPSDFRSRIRTIYLMRYLCENGLYKIDEIVDFLLREYKAIAHDLRVADCVLFAPEVEAKEPTFFIDVKKTMSAPLAQLLSVFYDNYDDLKADNWKLFYEVIKENGLPGSIRNVIKNDDIDTLMRENIDNPNFNYQMKLPISVFEPISMLQRGTTLLQAAAFFGSIKCMKYLMLCGCKAKDLDSENYNLSIYAVTGGSLEAIRLAQQSGSSFVGAAQLAIEYFQFDVLNWIYLVFDKSIWNKDMYGRQRIHNAAISGNIRIIKDIQAENLETENVDTIWDESDPLFLAVKNDSIAAIQTILDFSHSSINVILDHQTIMHTAFLNSKDQTTLFLMEQLDKYGYDYTNGNHLFNDLFVATAFGKENLLIPLAKRIPITPEIGARILHQSMRNQRCFEVICQNKETFCLNDEIIAEFKKAMEEKKKSEDNDDKKHSIQDYSYSDDGSSDGDDVAAN